MWILRSPSNAIAWVSGNLFSWSLSFLTITFHGFPRMLIFSILIRMMGCQENRNGVRLAMWNVTFSFDFVTKHDLANVTGCDIDEIVRTNKEFKPEHN